MVEKTLNRKEFIGLYPKNLKKRQNEQKFRNEKQARDKIELVKLAFELGCSVEDLR